MGDGQPRSAGAEEGRQLEGRLFGYVALQPQHQDGVVRHLRRLLPKLEQDEKQEDERYDERGAPVPEKIP